MRSSIMLLLLISASLPLAAQPPLSGSRPEVDRFPPDQMACPVDLRADRRAGVITREVDGKPMPSGQGLILHFAHRPERKVISADVTVYGYSGSVMALPLEAKSKRELSEEFHLTGSVAEPLLNPAIGTAKILGITAVELTRVTFSDGTTWQRSAPSECRIEPSLFVLVK